MIAGRQASGASISFGYVDEDGMPRLTQLPMTDLTQLPGAPVPRSSPPSTQK